MAHPAVGHAAGPGADPGLPAAGSGVAQSGLIGAPRYDPTVVRPSVVIVSNDDNLVDAPTAYPAAPADAQLPAAVLPTPVPAAPGYPPAYPYQYPYQYPMSRGSAPSVVPVVLFTCFFGIFGAISAYRRGKRAQAVGESGSRYWRAYIITTFAGVLVNGILVALLLAAGVGSPTVTAAGLANSIVNDGQFRDGAGNAVTVTDASCAEDEVNAKGVGSYRCTIEFSDGDSQMDTVTVERTGRWFISRHT